MTIENNGIVENEKYGKTELVRIISGKRMFKWDLFFNVLNE
jgi:hypothetical protein